MVTHQDFINLHAMQWSWWIQDHMESNTETSHNSQCSLFWTILVDYIRSRLSILAIHRVLLPTTSRYPLWDPPCQTEKICVWIHQLRWISLEERRWVIASIVRHGIITNLLSLCGRPGACIPSPASWNEAEREHKRWCYCRDAYLDSLSM